MQQVFRAIGRLSRSSVSVLITGSRHGKELVARALHDWPRAGRPFIALNGGDPVRAVIGATGTKGVHHDAASRTGDGGVLDESAM